MKTEIEQALSSVVVARLVAVALAPPVDLLDQRVEIKADAVAKLRKDQRNLKVARIYRRKMLIEAIYHRNKDVATPSEQIQPRFRCSNILESSLK